MFDTSVVDDQLGLLELKCPFNAFRDQKTIQQACNDYPGFVAEWQVMLYISREITITTFKCRGNWPFLDSSGVIFSSGQTLIAFLCEFFLTKMFGQRNSCRSC